MNAGLFRNLFSVLNLFGWLLVVAVIPGVCSLTLHEVKKRARASAVNEEIVVFTVPTDVKELSLPPISTTPPVIGEFTVNKSAWTLKEKKFFLTVRTDVKAPSLPPLSSIPSIVEESKANIVKSRSRRSLEKEAERMFNPLIIQAATRYGVDPALVKAVIMAESEYNPRAVSRVGAGGLMQLMPRTADYLGVRDVFNPEHNINGGVKYLKQLLDQFKGDVTLALAAYNAGSSKVRKYKGIPPIRETRNYVKKVFRFHEKYKKEMAGDVSSSLQEKPETG